MSRAIKLFISSIADACFIVFLIFMLWSLFQEGKRAEAWLFVGLLALTTVGTLIAKLETAQLLTSLEETRKLVTELKELRQQGARDDR